MSTGRCATEGGTLGSFFQETTGEFIPLHHHPVLEIGTTEVAETLTMSVMCIHLQLLGQMTPVGTPTTWSTSQPPVSGSCLYFQGHCYWSKQRAQEPASRPHTRLHCLSHNHEGGGKRQAQDGEGGKTSAARHSSTLKHNLPKPPSTCPGAPHISAEGVPYSLHKPKHLPRS